jgi:hypothetical protein
VTCNPFRLVVQSIGIKSVSCPKPSTIKSRGRVRSCKQHYQSHGIESFSFGRRGGEDFNGGPPPLLLSGKQRGPLLGKNTSLMPL